MVVSVQAPFPIFCDATGAPIDAGYVYCGTENLNPLTPANRISVFSDAALTIALDNPVRTSGGYPVDASGNPVNIYAAGQFSISIADRNNVVRVTSPSYGFRVLSSAITFDTVVVGTSIVPDAAGGASDGSASLPWSKQTTRDLQAKTATIYNTAQPTVAADLAALNQRRMPVMIGRQSVSGGAPSSVNIYNVASIVRTAAVPAGSYDITPTIALPASISVHVTGTLSSGTAQSYLVVARSTTLIRVETYFAGVLTDLAFDFVVFGNPAVADPIS